MYVRGNFTAGSTRVSRAFYHGVFGVHLADMGTWLRRLPNHTHGMQITEAQGAVVCWGVYVRTHSSRCCLFCVPVLALHCPFEDDVSAAWIVGWDAFRAPTGCANRMAQLARKGSSRRR